MRAPSSTAATDEEPPPPAPAIAIAAEDVHMHDEDGAAGESTSASTPELTTTTTDLADLTLGEVAEKPVLSMDYILHSPEVFQAFARWSPSERADFLHRLVLPTLTHLQLGALQNVIRPMLQRDFIATLPYALSDNVLTYLDAPSLRHSERVSVAWRDQLATCQVWKKLLERSIRCDRVWAGIAKRRGWDQFLLVSREEAQRRMFDMWMPALRSPFMQRMFELRRIEDIRYQQHAFYQLMYAHVEQDIKKLEQNWRRGVYTLSRITCQSIQAKGVYCLQYDDDKIVSGLRDTTIKIWNRSNLECVNTLTGHTGSVLCLQYDDKIIVSGSSDATVRVWCVRTGECLNQLIHHQEAVLHLRFSNGVMVTCSKDRMIAVWDMHSPKNISIRQVLSGHRAAVNVVDFDSKYIVSASGDRTIRVWNAGTLECERTLTGHKRGIACLQYRERLIVSGSSDCTIRLWDIVSGTCIRVLEGHEELVRCIRFDSKRIVSGAYDGKIKVWDLQAALDPQTIPNSLCLTTLSQHTGRVFRLQFDDFQIVSSSHDDTILIWDFLDRDPCGLKTGRGNAGGFGAREDDASLDVVQQEERAEAAVLPLDVADEEEDEP